MISNTHLRPRKRIGLRRRGAAARIRNESPSVDRRNGHGRSQNWNVKFEELPPDSPAWWE